MARIPMVLTGALALAGSTIASAQVSRSDPGLQLLRHQFWLVNSLQITVLLDRTEFLPDERLTAVVCYKSTHLGGPITIIRPGTESAIWREGESSTCSLPPRNWGQRLSLSDSAGDRLAPGYSSVYSLPPAPMVVLEEAAWHWTQELTLRPGEEYYNVAQEPIGSRGTDQYRVGHYGLQARYYYGDREPLVPPDPCPCNHTSDFLPNPKSVYSDVVWFDRVERLPEARVMGVAINGVAVAGARPLRVRGVTYVHAQDMASLGVTVGAKGDDVAARRGEHEATLPLGRWSPERPAERPAIPDGGAVYLPLRRVATALGLRVNWDPVRQIADVRT